MQKAGSKTGSMFVKVGTAATAAFTKKDKPEEAKEEDPQVKRTVVNPDDDVGGSVADKSEPTP